MLRRFNTGYEDGNYGVIAGHLDGNETVIEAMIREAREEAGISLAGDDLLVVGVMHRFSEYERIDFFLTASAWAGEARNAEPTRCDRIAWFSLGELPANTISYIRRALENWQRGAWFDTYFEVDARRETGPRSQGVTHPPPGEKGKAK